MRISQWSLTKLFIAGYGRRNEKVALLPQVSKAAGDVSMLNVAQKNAGRGFIPNRVDIDERPNVVDNKEIWRFRDRYNNR